MRPTVVEVAPRGDGVTCSLEGDLVIPRLIRRRGRSVDVALVAGRAMLLPGDDVRMRISVGEGCTLGLVDIGGLVVYGRDGEPGDASQWHAGVDLGTDAHLVWDSLPTVITDAGVLTRSLTVRLAAGASARVRETLVLGRTDERGGRLRADTDVADADGPLLRETLEVGGRDHVPGVLGAARVMDGIISIGDHAAIGDAPGAARLDLERGGTVLRYLGADAHSSPLGGVFAEAAIEHETGAPHVV
ncbi:urease accessory protein UreD [Microbacter sp. GSS18]|nr:urease accessory protein UreD [Microbacter sp. GSS18]